jgi:hypothetical protein
MHCPKPEGSSHPHLEIIRHCTMMADCIVDVAIPGKYPQAQIPGRFRLASASRASHDVGDVAAAAEEEAECPSLVVHMMTPASVASRYFAIQHEALATSACPCPQ